MMTLGLAYVFFNQIPVASVTRATFSTVKSSAIIALHPSVPNFIFCTKVYYILAKYSGFGAKRERSQKDN
jgi:hypothetical protein